MERHRFAPRGARCATSRVGRRKAERPIGFRLVTDLSGSRWVPAAAPHETGARLPVRPGGLFCEAHGSTPSCMAPPPLEEETSTMIAHAPATPLSPARQANARRSPRAWWAALVLLGGCAGFSA